MTAGSSASSRRLILLVASAVAVALVTVGRQSPLIIYNATASAPIGFYRVLPPKSVGLGDLVLVRMPANVRDLARDRGYLPARVPLVKRIAAQAGDHVCAFGSAIMIDGHHVADQRAADAKERPLPAWQGCRALSENEIFLLMTESPDSFDSRYFGPVPKDAVIGRLSALWLS